MKQAICPLITLVVLSWLVPPAHAAEQAAASLANPFYAMDTAFKRAELSHPQQLDLVKELGYAGVAWTEQGTDQVKAVADDLDQRALKMFTIYCSAKVTPDGQLTNAPNLLRIMETLKGHDTIIWLHIGGKGPQFDALNPNDPVVKRLLQLADQAAENGLRIAIYPHVGEWTARFADAVRLAKVVNHKAFGVTFNLCHALAQGDEPRIPALLEEARPVLMTVTICGADSGVTGGNWGRLIQPLDKGSYDTGVVLRKLKEIGFTGPIGFQGYGIRSDARSILTPTMAAWRKLSAAAK